LIVQRKAARKLSTPVISLCLVTRTNAVPVFSIPAFSIPSFAVAPLLTAHAAAHSVLARSRVAYYCMAS